MNAQLSQSRSWLPVILILSVIALGLFAFWQHKSMLALRTENQVLRQTKQEIERLRQENAQIEQWRSMAGEVEKLRKENQELNRLRNEIRQLRAQAPELEQLRKENQRLLAASQQLVAQKAAAETQLAQTSAEHAAVLAAQVQAESTECINQLKQITLACRMWANENNQVLPQAFGNLNQILTNPGILICPSDPDRAAAASWQQFQPGNTSYTLVSPGGRDDPTNVVVQCTLHGHVGMGDGSVQSVRPSQ